MRLFLASPTSATRRVLERLRVALKSKQIYCPADVTQFVFLCGANKPSGGISARRQALLDFARKHLPDVNIFVVERFFEQLRHSGEKKNLLDIEHLISDFADKILIVLEGSGAFCELGAFSHTALRDKLIVINDKEFRGSKSFINDGPLQAIREKAGDERIIHYKMSADGVTRTDAIGETFGHLHNIFQNAVPRKQAQLTIHDCDPKESFNKNAIRFIHDLVYLVGPITYADFIKVLIFLFGKGDYKDVSHHLYMLKEFGAINQVLPLKLWRSNSTSLYLKYTFDIYDVAAAFRSYHLKNSPARYYETK
jgi:hypothetical protein